MTDNKNYTTTNNNNHHNTLKLNLWLTAPKGAIPVN